MQENFAEFNEQTEQAITEGIEGLIDEASKLKNYSSYWTVAFSEQMDVVVDRFNNLTHRTYEIRRVAEKEKAEQAARELLNKGYKFHHISIDANDFQVTNDGKLIDHEDICF